MINLEITTSAVITARVVANSAVTIEGYMKVVSLLVRLWVGETKAAITNIIYNNIFYLSLEN